MYMCACVSECQYVCVYARVCIRVSFSVTVRVYESVTRDDVFDYFVAVDANDYIEVDFFAKLLIDHRPNVDADIAAVVFVFIGAAIVVFCFYCCCCWCRDVDHVVDNVTVKIKRL